MYLPKLQIHIITKSQVTQCQQTLTITNIIISIKSYHMTVIMIILSNNRHTKYIKIH